jgi:hypothetical protein
MSTFQKGGNMSDDFSRTVLGIKFRLVSAGEADRRFGYGREFYEAEGGESMVHIFGPLANDLHWNIHQLPLDCKLTEALPLQVAFTHTQVKEAFEFAAKLAKLDFSEELRDNQQGNINPEALNL